MFRSLGRRRFEQGEHTRPRVWCPASTPGTIADCLKRSGKGKVRQTDHSHREEHGRDVTSLIAKAVRRGRRTITRETRVLPDPSASMRLRSTKAVFEQVLGSRAIYLRGETELTCLAVAGQRDPIY